MNDALRDTPNSGSRATRASCRTSHSAVLRRVRPCGGTGSRTNETGAGKRDTGTAGQQMPLVKNVCIQAPNSTSNPETADLLLARNKDGYL